MKLKTLNKRSASFVFRSSQPSANIASVVTAINNMSSDIGDIMAEYNNKIKPAFNSLAKGEDDSISGLTNTFDAIRNGIDGVSIFTDRNSDENSSEWIYSAVLSRPLTLKESLAEIYQSLTEKIDTLGSATSGATFEEGGVVFGLGTSTPSTDSENLFWDADNLRLGIGTNEPLQDLDVRGIGSFSGGIVSYGGNARGLNAIDLQYSRASSDQVASGNYTFIQGINNKATGIGAIALGSGNTISGVGSIAFGVQNTITSAGSLSLGSKGKAYNYGQKTIASGSFVNVGDAQTSLYVLRNTTASTLPNNLFLDGVSETLSMESNKVYLITAEVTGTSSAGVCCGYRLEGLFKNLAGVGSISGSIIKTVINEEDAGLDANLSITMNTIITVTVTGLAATDMHWVAYLRVVEVTTVN